MELISPGTAADILGVTTETLRRYEMQGFIESEKTPGGHRRFQKEEVDLLVESIRRNQLLSEARRSREELEQEILLKQTKSLDQLLNDLDLPSGQYFPLRKLTEVSEYSNWLSAPLCSEIHKQPIGVFLVDPEGEIFFIFHKAPRVETLHSKNIKDQLSRQAEAGIKPITDSTSFAASLEFNKSLSLRDWIRNDIGVSTALLALIVISLSNCSGSYIPVFLQGCMLVGFLAFTYRMKRMRWVNKNQRFFIERGRHE